MTAETVESSILSWLGGTADSLWQSLDGDAGVERVVNSEIYGENGKKSSYTLQV